MSLYSPHFKPREAYIAECRELLGSVASDDLVAAAAEDTAASDSSVEQCADDRRPCCPKCQARMQWISFQRKPSWRTIMRGPHRPTWYRCRDR
jgi:hypothetical protein